MRKKLRKVLDKGELLAGGMFMAAVVYALFLKRTWRQRNEK